MRRNYRILFNCFFCFISVFTGGLIYVIFRERTHISILIKDYIDLELIKEGLQVFDIKFVKYYLPDMMWGMGLSFGLVSVFPDNIKYLYISGGIAFLCGAVWEGLQFIGAVFGTGDLIDILLYLAASVVAVSINIIIFRRRT